ncbi:MAG TPA: tRNA preQ1(34) S-adenosylmethionine ribosyltransferase-isomerase QueA [Polyangiaceae bacterium]|nr:tRNA preQ1(34) S-adenosylmethionine ribosyltransferase-isomerase QueA [Polyangiaceae bacterium]
MRVDAFHYDLPPERIAQRPADDREGARLMHLPGFADGGAGGTGKGDGEGDGRDGDGGDGARALEHRRVADLPDLLPEGALVVLNDTRVFPARLLGRKRDSGGRVEIFLLRRVGARDLAIAPGQSRSAEVWRAMGKSSKSLRFGSDVDIVPRRGDPHGTEGPAALVVRLLGRSEEDGLLEVALWTPDGGPTGPAIEACGHVPLPPYIKREDSAEDSDRYQTVYARHEGAVAAPTAGLHLTRGLLDRIAARCEVATLTLHVGLGTFQPVQVQDLDDHPMHSERYVVSPAVAGAVERARARGAPVIAIGTTTARALESAADPARPGLLRAASEETRLLIQPGYAWRVVDGLLTNFHLPGSTLLALVCAFAGTERVLSAYRLAVSEGYRFFSYGDAMLLSRAP